MCNCTSKHSVKDQPQPQICLSQHVRNSKGTGIHKEASSASFWNFKLFLLATWNKELFTIINHHMITAQQQCHSYCSIWVKCYWKRTQQPKRCIRKTKRKAEDILNLAAGKNRLQSLFPSLGLQEDKKLPNLTRSMNRHKISLKYLPKFILLFCVARHLLQVSFLLTLFILLGEKLLWNLVP